MNINDISVEEKVKIARDYRKSQLDAQFAVIGEMKVYEDCTTVSYANTYCKSDSYEEWLNKAINRIPDWMSRNEFMGRFGEFLREEFDSYIANRAEKVDEHESEEWR